MALPKQYRLTRSQEFSRVYQSDRKASSKHLVVKLISVPGEQSYVDCSRFGITISQKVSKRAVVRNRLKRQIRAALQTLMPRLQTGLWVVVIVRTAAIHCDYWQFLRELEELFLELEVLDGH